MSKEIKFWRYYVPAEDGEGWGIFLLDSTGMFSAVTDYGNCAYRWSHHGCNDFREFFRGDSWDYYLNKLFQGQEVYQQDETLQAVKERIIHLRWERRVTEEWAREEWDLLERHEDLYSESDFTRWYDETRVDDAGEYYTRGHNSSAKAFVRKLMPRFAKMALDDLANERKQINVVMNTG